MPRNRVNVLSVINSASNISEIEIDGVPHIVVRGVVPIVDNIVMNGKLYPADRIENSYKTLENKPMPYDHPRIGNVNISASDVRAIHDYHVGAWFQDGKHADGRVSGDMYVNRRYAEASEKGKTLINRLDDMIAGKNVEPIHISTGLLYNEIVAEGKSNGKPYKTIVTEMEFDHVAILLNKKGAGTPTDGVGIFVNSDGTETEIETVSLSEGMDFTRQGPWNKTKFYLANASNYTFDEIATAIRNRMKEGKPDDYYPWPEAVWPDRFIYQEDGKYWQQRYVIDDTGAAEFLGSPVEVVRRPVEYEIKTNGDEQMFKEMMINALKAAGKPVDGLSDEQLFTAHNALVVANAKAKPDENEEIDPKTGKPKLKASVTGNEELLEMITNAVNTAVEPLKTQLATNADKDASIKRAAVKQKFELDDLAVNEMQGALLDSMYAKCQTTTGLHPHFQFNVDSPSDQWKGYDLNADIDAMEEK
ncbi:MULTISPECIES: DUF2213 domain-containing protein [Enterobacterales]|uniref:DUF2213 domain-containing protein n=1 Tax=Enterobacterales TaxID=91347 RepID=UPI002ED88C99